MTVESIPLEQPPEEPQIAPSEEPQVTSPESCESEVKETEVGEQPKEHIAPPPKRGKGRPPGSKNKPKIIAEPIESSSREPSPEPVKARREEKKTQKIQPQVSDIPPIEDMFRQHLQQIHDRARLEHDARRSHYTRLLEQNLGVR